MLKNPPADAGDPRDMGSVAGSEDSLQKEMETHPSILAWKIPRPEDPGRLSPWGRKELDTTE